MSTSKYRLLDDDYALEARDTRIMPTSDRSYPSIKHIVHNNEHLDEIFGKRPAHARLCDENDEVCIRQVAKTKNEIYAAADKFFEGIYFTKIREMQNNSIYKASIQTQTFGEPKYLVVVTQNDRFPIGTTTTIDKLKWVCIQTRRGIDNDIKNFRSYPYKRPLKTIFDDRIIQITRINGIATYDCDSLPLKIEVINLKEEEPLAKTGTVVGAMDLFQTVIIMLE